MLYEVITDTAAVLEVGGALRTAVGDLPIIFTRRSVREGGEPIPIGDEQVVALYDAVGAARLVDFIDFEMGNDPEHVITSYSIHYTKLYDDSRSAARTRRRESSCVPRRTRRGAGRHARSGLRPSGSSG